MHAAFVVFVKEMTDNLRDRRSITMAMVYPLIGPILLSLLLAFVGTTLRIDPDQRLTIAIVNDSAAPELVAYFSRSGVVIRSLRDDPVAAVQRGQVPFVVVVRERSATDKRLRVQLIADPGRFSTLVPVSRTLELLRGYGRETTLATLRAAGLDERAVEPIVIEHENVGRTLSLAALFLNMMAPFLMFTIFIGGVYLALDSTSGERERGSMEPLLINPVSRLEVLLGKLGAAYLFTLIAVAVQVMAFAVMLELTPPQGIGLVDPPGAAHMALVFLLCLPLALFAVTLQVLIAVMTRSLKEAQTYLGLLPLIPSIPGMILVFAPLKTQGLLAAIPTFGQTLLIGQIIRGDGVSALHVLVSIVATLIATAALLAWTARLFEREQAVFAN
jgi:sodium transport system permease protein